MVFRMFSCGKNGLFLGLELWKMSYLRVFIFVYISVSQLPNKVLGMTDFSSFPPIQLRGHKFVQS